MKLFRLKSNKDSLLFEGDLNTNIILPKQSKIALLNVAFQKAVNEIKISHGNDEIKFTIGGINYTAYVDRFSMSFMTYTNINITNLLIMMEDSMNALLGKDEPFVIGGSWRITENENTQVQIKFKQNPVVNIVEAKLKGYANIGITDTLSTDITKTNLSSSLPDSALGVVQDGSVNYECYVSNFRYIEPDNLESQKIPGDLGGCGYLRCQINNISTVSTNKGFFIGLSSKKITGFNNNFAVGRFLYAIYAKNTTVPYEYMDNTNSGQPVIGPVGFNPQADDLLEIALSGGKMLLTVYSTSHPNGRVLFNAMNTEINHVVYPYLVFYDQALNSVCNYEFTPLNKAVTSNTQPVLTSQALLNYNGGVTPPIQNLSVRIFKLNWSGFAPWYLYLGFESITEQFEYKTVTFVGDQKPNFVDNTETYLVNINNQSVESYDMSVDFKGKRNLIAVIQNIRNKLDPDVLFTTETPIFIDLNNSSDIMLKNLNLSIISAIDNSRPVIIGYSNMTLLIE